MSVMSQGNYSDKEIMIENACYPFHIGCHVINISLSLTLVYMQSTRRQNKHPDHKETIASSYTLLL